MSIIKKLFATGKNKKYKDLLADKTIYYGDGSLADQAIARQTLNRFADHVVCFADGQALQDRIREVTPDVVLVDTHLHGCNGFDIARTIRKDDSLPSIPVIVLIHQGEQLDEQKINRSGVTNFIKKPIKPEKILRHLERVFE